MKDKFNLNKSSTETLKHYANRLKEEYPKYTKKELYFFLRTHFDFIAKVVRDSHSLEEDAEIKLGTFCKLKFSRINYKYFLYHKFMAIKKKYDGKCT